MNTFTRLALLMSVLGLSLDAACGVSPPAESTTVEQGESVPAGIREGYEKLAQAILTADLPSFMALFDMNFIYEATDGSCLDRGPWRRLWLTNLEELTYEKLSYEPEEVTEAEEGRRLIQTRRVMAYRKSGEEELRLQEMRTLDTWVTGDDGTWQLRYLLEKRLGIEGVVPAEDALPERSPRLLALAESLEGVAPAEAIGSFWESLGGKGPLVEDRADDPTHRWVTFAWRGRGIEEAVQLTGGVPSAGGWKPLRRLGDTDLWYRTEKIPSNARLTYSFRVSSRLRAPLGKGGKPLALPVEAELPDPLNPNQVDGRSYLELPEAPESPWLGGGDDVDEGELERYSVQSKILDERRFVYVYTPAGYDSMTEPLRVVYLLAGEDYASRQKTRAALDFLIAAQRIPPVIAVMVQSEGSKLKELRLDDAFVRFLGEEVVPWARGELDISEKPTDSTIGGNRVGAALSVAAATRYPELFGSVLTQSAVFPRGGLSPIRDLSSSEGTQASYYVEVGTLDDPAVQAASVHLRDVLEAKGYALTYREFPGNQSSRTWQDSLANGLLQLVGR